MKILKYLWFDLSQQSDGHLQVVMNKYQPKLQDQCIVKNVLH